MILAEEAKPDIALWRAVIAQALDDATRYVGGEHSSTAMANRNQALAWLTAPNAYFNHVCALADLEPSQVRAFAAKRIAEAEAKTPELEARYIAHRDRARAGQVKRKQREAGVVANFLKDAPDRTHSTAQDCP